MKYHIKYKSQSEISILFKIREILRNRDMFHLNWFTVAHNFYSNQTRKLNLAFQLSLYDSIDIWRVIMSIFYAIGCVVFVYLIHV